MRRLAITVAGRWYLALTIGLGVAALASANNVVYLIESLLLSGLIFSGILSERTVAAIEIETLRSQAIAGEDCGDRIRVRNHSKSPLFCVEIDEWKEKKLHPLAYVPRLDPGGSIVVPTSRAFGRRGNHRWEGYAIATSYPFGFARKVRIEKEDGSRIVWPSRQGGAQGDTQDSLGDRRKSLGTEVTEAEVRPYVVGDDPRLIVWTLSARGTEPMVRVRRRSQGSVSATLDLRTPPGEEFEKQVIHAAKRFHDQESDSEAVLTLVGRNGTRKIRGRRQALDQLALVEAEGAA